MPGRRNEKILQVDLRNELDDFRTWAFDLAFYCDKKGLQDKILTPEQQRAAAGHVMDQVMSRLLEEGS